MEEKEVTFDNCLQKILKRPIMSGFLKVFFLSN